MKSSFLPKYEPNIVRISALLCGTLQGRNPYNFWFIFWENDDFINSFWNLLTFNNRDSSPHDLYRMTLELSNVRWQGFEKLHWLILVFSWKEMFFLIITVLNCGIRAISFWKNHAKPGTILIEIPLAHRTTYLKWLWSSATSDDKGSKSCVD